MYLIKTSNQFEKDFVRCLKRNYPIDSLGKVVEFLESSGKLPRSYKAHQLSGNYKGFWECHIKSDWLLIWRQDDKSGVIELVRTGSHTDLFR